MVVVGLFGTSLSALENSVMVFWILASDMTYTVLLPQLICVLYLEISNGYGAIIGYFVALLMRVLCGEPLLGIPVILQFPGCTLENGVYIQHWPIKTICMLSGLVSVFVFSLAASHLFNKGILPEEWDVFKVKFQGAPTPLDDINEEVVKEEPLAPHENGSSVLEPMLDTRC